MNQQQELRRAAEEAFIESLEQLQQTLESNDRAATPVQAAANPAITAPKPPCPPARVKPTGIDLASLEDAIADIEQFIEQKSQPE